MKFGTDGVRGRAHTDLTVDDAARLARAVVRVFRSDAVAVGRDTRESGPHFVDGLARGVAAEGAALIDLGVAPTPEVAYLAGDFDVAAVMVSASHNSWRDNGLKVFAPGGRKLTDEQQVQIEAMLNEVAAPELSTSEQPVRVSQHDDGGERYLHHVAGALEGRDLACVKVVLDCANGAASEAGPDLFRSLGADVTVLHASPDGRNINEGCGSTDLTDVRAATIDVGAHLGLAFDGDADRVLAVAGDGRPVDGDVILALAAVDLRDRSRLTDNTVVVTVMSNLGFHRAMDRQAIAVHVTPVGDRNVLDALDANGWVLGGEQSGHVIFRTLATTGDGLLTGALLADLVNRSGGTLADLASMVVPVPQFLENVPITGTSTDMIESLAQSVAEVEAELGDRGRIVLRASGTEPLIRVMVEADDEVIARRHVDRLVDEVAAIERSRPGH